MIGFVGLASFVLTIFFYYAAKAIYKRINIVLFSPLLVAPTALVICLLIFHTSYTSYTSGGKWLALLLQPSIVAFAIPLHKNFGTLKKHFTEIVVSVFVGAFFSLLISVLLGLLANFKLQIIVSLAPRSITTPIAMVISQNIGGIPALTAVFVIITGLLGLIMGPSVIQLLHLRSPIAKGVLLGTSAHACGTSTALAIGSLEGTIASLSMIFTGLMTVVLAPQLCPLLLRIL